MLRRSGPLRAAAAIFLAFQGPPETDAWPISACATRRATGRRHVARSPTAKLLSKLPWEDGYGQDDNTGSSSSDGGIDDGGVGDRSSSYEEAADVLFRRGLPADAGRPLSPSERIRGAVLGGDLGEALRTIEREMGEGGGWNERKEGDDGENEEIDQAKE